MYNRPIDLSKRVHLNQANYQDDSFFIKWKTRRRRATRNT